MKFKKFDEWYKEQEIAFSEKFEAAMDESIKEFVKDAYSAGLMQGFNGRQSTKKILQDHEAWFCRTDEPLLATFSVCGKKSITYERYFGKILWPQKMSRDHARWFCEIIEPLLATFMEHGIKHGRGMNDTSTHNAPKNIK